MGRIGEAALRDALQELQVAHLDQQEQEQEHSLDIFLCGPPKMTEAIMKELIALGVKKDRIHYEKWW